MKTNLSTIIESDTPTVIECFNSNRASRNFYDWPEDKIEIELFSQLKNQGFEELSISSDQSSEEKLIENLRLQLEKINKTKFTNSEWENIRKEWLLKSDNTIKSCHHIFQRNNLYQLTRDNGELINIKLMDSSNIHNNILQVMRQYTSVIHDGKRYDMIVLFNGFPVVLIELKRWGHDIQDAFNQVNKYRDEIEKGEPSLLQYIHLFVISNVNKTKYFSNRQIEREQKNNLYKSNLRNSIKFTINWSDAKNQKIENLYDFAECFFAKKTFLNLITNYCVLRNNDELIVLRPYQIVAVEKVLQQVNKTINNKKLWCTREAGGYIWHSTGSGKTITSFKCAEMIKRKFISTNEPKINRVFFVVDRIDLDNQTINEYEKLENGFACSIKSQRDLCKKLRSDDNKVIVTTIQKLSRFIDKNQQHEIYDEPIIMIFDECHRSQFGLMHQKICNKFKKYCLFGFTGTPIFPENAKNGPSGDEIAKDIKMHHNNKGTTEELFGKQLHTYNILNAIGDGSVLKFHYNELKDNNNPNDFLNPLWLKRNTDYIIEYFGKYCLRKPGMQKYNSIFAVRSIDQAIAYYKEFKKYKSDLKVFTIFSTSNYDKMSDVDEDPNSIDALSESHKDFLKTVVAEYNKIFGSNFDIELKDGFNNFYRDVSKKLKNTEIDILIVVGMFLTGFDAPTLNTLWIDKNLEKHNLLQAFARTNRICNETKECGQIVSFIGLKEKMDEAISLYSSSSDYNYIFMREFEDYYNGYIDEYGNKKLGYREVVSKLLEHFPLERMENVNDKSDFIDAFNKFLVSRNNLLVFADKFDDGKKIISDEIVEQYIPYYRDFQQELRDERNENKIDNKSGIGSDSNDRNYPELILEYTDVNVNYILGLIGKKILMNQSRDEFIREIKNKINASNNLYKNSEMLLKFCEKIYEERDNQDFNIKENIFNLFNEFKKEHKTKEIDALINKYNLKQQETHEFINNAIENGNFKSCGRDLSELSKTRKSFFNNKNDREDEEWKEQLRNIYNKYKNI